MIKVGDTVKIIGTTECDGVENECIKIGTICEVIATENDPKTGLIVGVTPKETRNCEYWYLEKDVEKGHLEWVKD